MNKNREHINTIGSIFISAAIICFVLMVTRPSLPPLDHCYYKVYEGELVWLNHLNDQRSEKEKWVSKVVESRAAKNAIKVCKRDYLSNS